MLLACLDFMLCATEALPQCCSVSSSVEANVQVVDIFTSAASFSSDFLHTPKASHAVLQQLPNQATYIFDTAAGSPSDLSWWP